MSIIGSALGYIPGIGDDLQRGYDKTLSKIHGALDRRGNSAYQGVNQGNFNLPGYNQQYNNYGNLANRWGGYNAPIQNYNSQAANSAFRGQQVGLGNQLYEESQGRGIGQNLIGMQARNAADTAARQQLAQASSAPASMQAAAARNAAFNTGNIQSQVGGQAAMAGGQYQLGAMNNFGQFLQGARGQDEGLNQFNAQQRAQQAQFNTGARMEQEQRNRDAMLEAYRQRLMASQLQQQGGMGYEQQRTARYGADMGVPTFGETAFATGGEILGSILGGGG